MLASDIITRAAIILQDETHVRWPDEAELLLWISDAQREIVIARPEISVINGPITLTANTTKQSLPAGGLTLMNIIRNLGVGGNTPGRAIRVCVQEVLDAQRPNWHTESAEAQVKHFVFDKRDRKTFYVWPRPSGALQVEAVYSAVPQAVTALNQTLAVDDIFINPMLDYVLYRAYSKDSEYAGNAGRAAAHYTQFANSLGIQTSTERAYSPAMNSMLNPNNPVGTVKAG